MLLRGSSLRLLILGLIVPLAASVPLPRPKEVRKGLLAKRNHTPDSSPSTSQWGAHDLPLPSSHHLHPPSRGQMRATHTPPSSSDSSTTFSRFPFSPSPSSRYSESTMKSNSLRYLLNLEYLQEDAERNQRAILQEECKMAKRKKDCQAVLDDLETGIYNDDGMFELAKKNARWFHQRHGYWQNNVSVPASEDGNSEEHLS